MYCGGVPLVNGGRGQSAEGACNNACYYTNQDPLFVARYSSDTDANRNRVQSGCNTKQGSVCNLMPFSQSFHDPIEYTYQSDPNDYEYNCDEFPTARMTQADFGAPGRKPNSLLCINKKENTAMGVQLNQFIQGTGNGLAGRTCDGPLPDDSTFKIVFDYEGADISKLGFCKDLPGESGIAIPDPWYQFYLTSLGGGSSGRISFPYNPPDDNHYAVATTRKDVLQCTVSLQRTVHNEYIATVYDTTRNIYGSAKKNLPAGGDTMILPGQNGVMDLAIIATGPAGSPGTVGTPIDFNYGARSFDAFQEGTDFFWGTLSIGTDGHFSSEDSDVKQPGGYCAVTNIDGEKDPPAQQILCYFPCNAQ